jgi:asparagine synthetase B (glutamine-hydrolysing)
MEYTKAFTAFARPGDSTGLEYWSTPDIHSLPLPYKTAVTAKLSRQAIADYTRTLVVLGTHRVPTIDTTLNTYQPMEYKKSSALVLSGDVYNYKELKDLCDSTTDPINDTVSLVEYLANVKDSLPDILRRIQGEFSFVYVTGLDSFERKPTVLAVRDTIGTRPLYVLSRRDTIMVLSNPAAIPLKARGAWSVTEIPAGHYYFNGTISKYANNNCDAKYTTVPWSNTEQLYTAIASLLETQVTRVYSHFTVPVGILVSGFCSLTLACLLAKNGHSITAFTLSTNNKIKIPNVPNIIESL